MSMNNSNESILEYIDANFSDKNNIEEEIEINLNNLLNSPCSKSYTPVNPITLNGISNSNNKSYIDLTFLVPNLFRKCFVQNSFSIPTGCPKYINKQNVTNYLPYLIDEEIIKSFLYFNFPASYGSYSILTDLINIRINAQMIVNKKKNTTYDSYTTAQKLLQTIYSPTSMLLQLVSFNNYIDNANKSVLNTQIINSFKILWDITIYCITYTGNVEDSYIVNNKTTNIASNNITTIDSDLGNNIYDIKYSSLNQFQTNNQFNNNGLIFLYSQNIYTVLNYAMEVYQDILLQIQTFIEGGIYCKKDYMNISNIPLLTKLYYNFYNNQLYVLSKELPVNLPTNVIPDLISINDYISQFNTIFQKTYPPPQYYNIKSFILNDNEGFTFYYSSAPLTGEILYNYYYINIGNPSAVLLTNSSIFIINYAVYISVENPSGAINRFISDFNTTENLNNININATSWILTGTYPKDGLYPNKGFDTTNVNNIGYTYSYFDSNNFLICKIYLLLNTNLINNAIGTALIYYNTNN